MFNYECHSCVDDIDCFFFNVWSQILCFALNDSCNFYESVFIVLYFSILETFLNLIEKLENFYFSSESHIISTEYIVKSTLKALMIHKELKIIERRQQWQNCRFRGHTGSTRKSPCVTGFLGTRTRKVSAMNWPKLDTNNRCYHHCTWQRTKFSLIEDFLKLEKWRYDSLTRIRHPS